MSITTKDQSSSKAIFEKLAGGQDYLTQSQFQEALRSEFPNQDAKVFNVSNPDQNGVYTLDAFTIAFYLMGRTTQKIAASDDKPGDACNLEASEKELKEALARLIFREKPNLKWEDVAGLEFAKEKLREAVVLPAKFPQLFSGKRKASGGILLYGPPGTGKSYLAKAVATEADLSIFSISGSRLVSKWLGESDKILKALFEMARENQPSMILIDEIDAIDGARVTASDDQQISGLKTELMFQIDGVGTDNTGVFILAATNLPWMLAPAIGSRFRKKVYIPLPDEVARAQMLNIHTGKSCHLSEGELAQFAKMAEGFSASDISNAVQDALGQPVKKVVLSKHWRKLYQNGKEVFAPCQPGDRGALPMTWRGVQCTKLVEPPVLVEDYFKVLQEAKPTVGWADIVKFGEWTKQYGMEGCSES